LAFCIMAAAALNAGSALAQEDLNRGKTPAQLFASDCAECHRNPRALAKRDNAYALTGFLRVHYTASRESAAAIANYLVSLGPDPRAATRPSGNRSRPAAAREQGRPNPAASRDQGKSSPAPEGSAKPAEPAPPIPPEPIPPAPAEHPGTPPASEAPAAPPATPQ
jgi:hypothetical protein